MELTGLEVAAIIESLEHTSTAALCARDGSKYNSSWKYYHNLSYKLKSALENQVVFSSKE